MFVEATNLFSAAAVMKPIAALNIGLFLATTSLTQLHFPIACADGRLSSRYHLTTFTLLTIITP